jgi:hypothetical protein
MSRFPVAFRLPAFASWVILSRWGVGPSLRSAYRSLPRTPSGFHVPHARVATGVGALLPRGRRCSHGRLALLRPPPAASQRQCPYTPVLLPSPRLHLTRHHRGFTCIHPSGLPLACGTRMERAPLGFPPSFAPRRYQRRTSGWGQALSTCLGLRSRQHRRPSFLRVHSQRATSCRTSALLAEPEPSGSAGPSRRCRGCFPPSPASPGSGCPQLP